MKEEKLVLNPYIKVVLCSEDEILIKHSVRSHFSLVIKDEKRTRLLGKILKNFKIPTSVEDLVTKNIIKQEEIKDMVELVDIFSSKNILIKPSEDIMNVYFKSILKSETQLSQYTIGIIGVGYLGFRILCELLKLGPKKINFCDERKVKNTEMETKFFDVNDLKVNESYVNITKSYISSKRYDNSEGKELKLDDEEGMVSFFKDIDFAVLSLEFFSPTIFHTINKVAIATQKPWALVYVDGSEGIIGPIIIPGETACYSEVEIQRESTIKFKDEYLLYKEYLEDEKIDVPNLVLPLYLNVVSNWATIFISRFLINKDPSLIEKVVFINFEDLSINFSQVMKLPRCPACQILRPVYKHSFV